MGNRASASVKPKEFQTPLTKMHQSSNRQWIFFQNIIEKNQIQNHQLHRKKIRFPPLFLGSPIGGCHPSKRSPVTSSRCPPERQWTGRWGVKVELAKYINKILRGRKPSPCFGEIMMVINHGSKWDDPSMNLDR